MSRAFGASSAAAFIAPNVSVITFVKLEFSSGTVYTHNGLGTYTWGGQDWAGVGDFGTISRLEEGADVSPYGITLELSAIDPTMSGAALNEDYFRRGVTIYIGALSADDELLDDPLQMWAGFMDSMSITAGDKSDKITLQCESELSEFDRSSNLRFTTQALQDEYPGDVFFEFLPKIDGVKILWKNNKSDSLAGFPSSGPRAGGNRRGSGRTGGRNDDR